MHRLAFALLAVTPALAQIPGTLTPEVHPSLPIKTCATNRGCKTLNTKVVLDSNYRWHHVKGGYDPCVNNGVFNAATCQKADDCAANCEVEGVDYSSYGISTSGDALTLNLFNPTGGLASPRVYLLKEDEQTYYKFRMLNKEFTYDVDVSNLPCGTNGALYFSEMAADGEQNNKGNLAGAAYGTGYCDAQCPKQNFIGGKANFDFKYGACCQEMDIWEANSRASAFTPHPCSTRGLFKCSGADCGSGSDRQQGICDMDGCDYNPFRLGVKNFYGRGPEFTVDTTKKMTVVTQFITKNGLDRDELVEIRRLYVQNGVVVANAAANLTGMPNYDSISDAYCEKEVEVLGGSGTNELRGGSKVMGEAFERGMVLAMSLWWDTGSYMWWLDGKNPGDPESQRRGPCNTEVESTPAYIQANYQPSVVFSNIKLGDFGTTY
ncbi:hypothetical protein H072_8306 [Dactylellina haptotyla CBS 200.50]|uniref:Glucanase n=1 Tax=Dactylellina haptotyla (strain CBS 200.50) TaxID=1284197 RepID=S8AA61_DACHA|nr:hypothetical protein H072_8306 [Dactylellina haptotyla CBS 200.50]